MNKEEKETYMKYCKYDKEPKKVIMNLVGVIEKQQAEIERLKQIISKTSVQFINDTIETDKKNKEDLEMLYRGCQAEIEKLRKEKIEYQPSITITNSELLKGK